MSKYYEEVPQYLKRAFSDNEDNSNEENVDEVEQATDEAINDVVDDAESKVSPQKVQSMFSDLFKSELATRLYAEIQDAEDDADIDVDQLADEVGDRVIERLAENAADEIYPEVRESVADNLESRVQAAYDGNPLDDGINADYDDTTYVHDDDTILDKLEDDLGYDKTSVQSDVEEYPGLFSDAEGNLIYDTRLYSEIDGELYPNQSLYAEYTPEERQRHENIGRTVLHDAKIGGRIAAPLNALSGAAAGAIGAKMLGKGKAGQALGALAGGAIGAGYGHVMGRATGSAVGYARGSFNNRKSKLKKQSEVEDYMNMYSDLTESDEYQGLYSDSEGNLIYDTRLYSEIDGELYPNQALFSDADEATYEQNQQGLKDAWGAIKNTAKAVKDSGALKSLKNVKNDLGKAKSLYRAGGDKAFRDASKSVAKNMMKNSITANRHGLAKAGVIAGTAAAAGYGAKKLYDRSKTRKQSEGEDATFEQNQQGSLGTALKYGLGGAAAGVAGKTIYDKARKNGLTYSDTEDAPLEDEVSKLIDPGNDETLIVDKSTSLESEVDNLLQ